MAASLALFQAVQLYENFYSFSNSRCMLSSLRASYIGFGGLNNAFLVKISDLSTPQQWDNTPLGDWRKLLSDSTALFHRSCSTHDMEMKGRVHKKDQQPHDVANDAVRKQFYTWRRLRKCPWSIFTTMSLTNISDYLGKRTKAPWFFLEITTSCWISTW